MQRIRFGRNPRDVFGQIAVLCQVNILRCFERADETERNFNVAGFDSIQIGHGFLEDFLHPFARNCGVHIPLCGLKDGQELLLRGSAILFGLVAQKLVIVRLEFLVTFRLLFAENCLVSILGSSQSVVICDLCLVGSRELVVGIACFCNGVIAVFIDLTDAIDHVNDFLCACILALDYIRHIIERMFSLDMTVIRNECVGTLFSRHLIDALAAI